MHIKNVRVTNPKNVLVQVPGFIASKWNLKEGDVLGVHITEDEQAVIVRPKEICTGSDPDKQSEGMTGDSIGYAFLQSVR